MRLTTYLNFDGTLAEAFKYYEQHLDGKITMMMPFSQMPQVNSSPEMANRILHAQIEIAGSTVLASDTPPGVAQPVRSSYLCIHTDSSPDAERYFAALIDGGENIMRMEETFFAYRYGIARDRFGVLWMVIHDKPMQA